MPIAAPVRQGLFGAIYLGPRGQGGTDTGSVAATVRNTALAFCTQNLKPGDPACFPYATGRTITFKPSLMGAFLIAPTPTASRCHAPTARRTS